MQQVKELTALHCQSAAQDGTSLAMPIIGITGCGKINRKDRNNALEAKSFSMSKIYIWMLSRSIKNCFPKVLSSLTLFFMQDRILFFYLCNYHLFFVFLFRSGFTKSSQPSKWQLDHTIIHTFLNTSLLVSGVEN